MRVGPGDRQVDLAEDVGRNLLARRPEISRRVAAGGLLVLELDVQNLNGLGAGAGEQRDAGNEPRLEGDDLVEAGGEALEREAARLVGRDLAQREVRDLVGVDLARGQRRGVASHLAADDALVGGERRAERQRGKPRRCTLSWSEAPHETPLTLQYRARFRALSKAPAGDPPQERAQPIHRPWTSQPRGAQPYSPRRLPVPGGRG